MSSTPDTHRKMTAWERVGLIATLIGTAVGLFAFFVYPTFRDMLAFPTVWTQGDGVNTITIHSSGDEILEKGELPFLLLQVPYTVDFQCQLKLTGSSVWEGKCLYNFTTAGGSRKFSCSVETNEKITSFTDKNIIGVSQPLEDPRGPNQCPTPKGGPSGQPTASFVLRPK